MPLNLDRSAASPVFSSCFDRLTYGYRLDNFITEEIFNIGVQSCMKECLLRKPHCQSINYNTQHFQCEVNSKGADILLEGTPDVNSIFANVVNVSKNFSNNCKEAVCQPLHKCVAIQHTHVCISTACKKGTYGKDGQCLPCPLGQYNNGSKRWCSLCPPGSYNDQTGSSFCQLCPTGTYNKLYGQTMSDSCKPCLAGYYQYVTGQSTCINCPIGSYQSHEGQSFCIACDDFYSCTNTKRTNCYGLKEHVGRIGDNGHNHGVYDRHECKTICQRDNKCRGFSINGVNNKCLTHTQIDNFASVSFNFYELPSECQI